MQMAPNQSQHESIEGEDTGIPVSTDQRWPTPVSPFDERVRQAGVCLRRDGIDAVQINVGRLCNQSCAHCHVDAGPHRTEIMDPRTAGLAIDLVRAADARCVDITGGAPELNPSFGWLVRKSVAHGCHVVDRCNLTVLSEMGQEDTPLFLADMGVEVMASLPCYTQENVDQQRGHGAFAKSVEALLRLNALGYGREGSGLVLNLVNNPLGAYLPASQPELEADYRRELKTRFGVCFNRLLTMTNMPMGRFARHLRANGEHEVYWLTLANAFNPTTLRHLMCRNMISVSWDGYIYDCDFNQALGRQRTDHLLRLDRMPATEIVRQLAKGEVQTGMHCFACTAGAGSSCGGALA